MYSTFEQLKDVVDEFKTVKSKREIKKEIKVAGAELVHEDGKYQIYWIKTKEAAIQLGTGTKWCISAHNYNKFTEYSLFFFFSRTLSTSNSFNPIENNNPLNASSV